MNRAAAALGFLIAAATLAAALSWLRAHSLPLWWDEANYANQAIVDQMALREGGPVAAVKALLFNDPERPPAYRALALPVTAVAEPRLPLLRGISLVGTAVAMVLLYLATRSVLAVAVVASMPPVFTSAAWFGTEYALFLAVALLLASLLRRISPVGVAVAVALGLLSKVTFVLIGGPALLATLFYARRDHAMLLKLCAASATGAVLASGWWVWHVGPALAFARAARVDARAFLGPDPIAAKAAIVAFDAFGIGLLIAFALPLVAVRRGPWSSEDRRALAIALAATLPLIIAASIGPTFGPRIYAPAFLGLTVPLAMLLDRAGDRIRLAVGLIALAQIVTIAVAPARFLPRVEQTDWRPLRRLTATNARPRIAFFGGWPSLSSPEVRYAWLRDRADADVQWLWRFEDGPVAWPRILSDAAQSDLVLVVSPRAMLHRDPHLASVVKSDNVHNAEFMRRLERSGAFEPPMRMRFGTYDPGELFLYRRMASDPQSEGSGRTAPVIDDAVQSRRRCDLPTSHGG